MSTLVVRVGCGDMPAAVHQKTTLKKKKKEIITKANDAEGLVGR
jgi:hypothetical protein